MRHEFHFIPAGPGYADPTPDHASFNLNYLPCEFKLRSTQKRDPTASSHIYAVCVTISREKYLLYIAEIETQ
jgi:hypothetical protein